MAVLKKLKKKKEKEFSYKEHPCKNLDLEIKIHYLNGLALLSNEDDSISSGEKEYLSILIESFGLDKEIIEECIEFATNPNEEAIFEMIKILKNQEVKYSFILDSLILASTDNNFDADEKALIDYYEENFELTEQEKLDIAMLFEFIQNKDVSSLYEKFKTTTIKKEYVEYSLEYYGIKSKICFKNDKTYFKTVSMSDDFSIFIDENRKIRTFGENRDGQLGIGTKDDMNEKELQTVIDLPDNLKCISVSNSKSHSLALFDNGDIYSWGEGSEGELGDKVYGDFKDNWEVLHLCKKLVPFKTVGLPQNIKPIKILAVPNSSIVLLENGELYICGSLNDKFIFTHYELNFNIINIEVMHDSSSINGLVLLAEDNKLYIQQISNNLSYCKFIFDDNNIFEPQGLPKGLKIKEISTGGYFVHVLLENNHLYGIGENDDGQLGIGKRSDYIQTFTRVMGIEEPILQLSTSKRGRGYKYDNDHGNEHNFLLALTKSNIYGWGTNRYQQLGKKDNCYYYRYEDGIVFKKYVSSRDFYAEFKPKVIEELSSHTNNSDKIELFCIDDSSYIWNLTTLKVYKLGGYSNFSEYAEKPYMELSQ